MTDTAVQQTAVRRYVAASVAVLLVVVAAAATGTWLFARTEAHQEARDVAQMFARTVAAPLRVADLDTSTDTVARAHLARSISGLLEDEDVYRVKIWRLDGDRAEIVYSDASTIDGLRVPVSADLTRALRTQEPVVTAVPDDPAHATENSGPHTLLEVYVPFRDADDVLAVAEVYLVTQVDRYSAELLVKVLPLAVGGPVLLVAATLPLALRLARSHARAERERRELADRALAVAEAERRDLARRLHDGVLQDLVALGMALELDTQREPGPLSTVRAGLVDRIHTEVGSLRGILDDLDPVTVDAGDLRLAFAAVAERHAPASVRVGVVGASLAQATGATRRLVLHSGSELLRNALAHSGAGEVVVDLLDRDGQIGLEVRDDGVGFDAGASFPGHHGLRLVRAAASGAGGTFEVSSDSSGTRVRLLVPHGTATVRNRPIGGGQVLGRFPHPHW
ncbi:hypothetical protein GCM10010413_30720 [Promicromonospora sukumoe]|uniref:Signal transduction histidine kinase n=1 Tax=Promicromonospora sukumoe TaxID=88382 RepID=A0A7W3PDS8_9MICO|nr:ATP-binding protein [Promicromonospora sukumoe]MBA8807824.1 signal transduction histidine kinase [Promicromonospora sukumoe]